MFVYYISGSFLFLFIQRGLTYLYYNVFLIVVLLKTHAQNFGKVMEFFLMEGELTLSRFFNLWVGN